MKWKTYGAIYGVVDCANVASKQKWKEGVVRGHVALSVDPNVVDCPASS
jgi:hypothetical protein